MKKEYTVLVVEQSCTNLFDNYYFLKTKNKLGLSLFSSE
jgi:hypothetical protein